MLSEIVLSGIMTVRNRVCPEKTCPVWAVRNRRSGIGVSEIAVLPIKKEPNLSFLVVQSFRLKGVATQAKAICLKMAITT